VIQIANIIKKTGLAPQRLRLEITESVAMVDADRARRVLEELRAIGVKLAIDDFGTGYSSLSCLQDYPLEILKIDRSFVNRMRQGDDGLQMVQTIINLARSLRMKVVAEGVESPDELALLKSMGCDLGQGYLFSKPVPENVMRQLAAAPRQEVEEASGNLWMTG
jgi:EAL domain-containing protein (putative c-di-GMP-specific phosphodiesterase class I)